MEALLECWGSQIHREHSNPDPHFSYNWKKQVRVFNIADWNVPASKMHWRTVNNSVSSTSHEEQTQFLYSALIGFFAK